MVQTTGSNEILSFKYNYDASERTYSTAYICRQICGHDLRTILTFLDTIPPRFGRIRKPNSARMLFAAPEPSPGLPYFTVPPRNEYSYLISVELTVAVVSFRANHAVAI
jgi:hypothetical protein